MVVLNVVYQEITHVVNFPLTCSSKLTGKQVKALVHKEFKAKAGAIWEAFRRLQDFKYMLKGRPLKDEKLLESYKASDGEKLSILPKTVEEIRELEMQKLGIKPNTVEEIKKLGKIGLELKV